MNLQGQDELLIYASRLNEREQLNAGVAQLVERHVANVIVDGSSPFTRSLTTADSKCQPLFILRTGRGLGRLGVVSGMQFFCQQLTAIAYPRLRFGTISGTVTVFLAPYLAPMTMGISWLSHREMKSVIEF